MSLVVLSGCRPEPLAGYLKALGALRLVSEQVDPAARGAWVGGVFHLESTLTEAGLVDFFARRYAPTPVITPWNGGSGFWPGDNQSGISPIRVSDSPRFEAYRSAITVAEAHIRRSGLEERPDSKQKAAFVSRLRATLSDAVLAWLDAALVFSRETLVFPPLLGTGGNDGRLDFANNFMQRLSEELLSPKAAPEVALRGALFGGPTPGLGGAAIGQYFPSAAGGANGGPGFDGSVGTNPWDFILLVEGAMCFATAMVRRLESSDRAAMTFPFSVRSTAAGFGTAADGETDSSRDELWLPLWEALASWPEIATVFREGRSRVGARSAQTGTDFARSLSALGVDRGLSSFTRYAFHVRNGLAYQAVPLGRWAVGREPEPVAALLEDIDRTLLEVSRVAGGEGPARLRVAARQLDEAILEAVRPGAGPGALQRLLLSLAEVEAAAADSRDHGGLRRPIPPLDAARWLPLLDDGSPELALAAALAPELRERWSTVRRFGPQWGWAEGAERAPPASRVWRRGPLELRLLELLQREQKEPDTQLGPASAFDLRARRFAPLSAVQAFLEGRTDDQRVVELARTLSLLEGTVAAPIVVTRAAVSPIFAAARLLVGGSFVPDSGEAFAPVPGWIAAARRDDGPAFIAMTWRRLTSGGLALRGLGRRSRAAMLRGGESISVRRLAAACRFPLSPPDLQLLASSITLSPSENP